MDAVTAGFDLELGELRSLVMLAEQGHFGRAARLLGVSQPALSKRLRRLEDKVGGALFLRGYRDVQVTGPGSILVERARELLREAERALEAARAAVQGTVGMLRIGYGVSSIAQLLPEVLLRFARAHPRVQIDIRDMSSGAQQLALSRGEVDLGFVRIDSPPRPSPHDSRERDEIEHVPILRERLVAAVAARSAWRERLGLSSLRHQPFVVNARAVSSSYYDHVVALCHGAGFTPRIVAESNELYSLLQLVRAGVGVALVPSSCSAMRVPRVRFTDLRLPQAVWTIALARRRATGPTPLVDSFVRVAREVAKLQASSAQDTAVTRR